MLSMVVDLIAKMSPLTILVLNQKPLSPIEIPIRKSNYAAKTSLSSYIISKLAMFV